MFRIKTFTIFCVIFLTVPVFAVAGDRPLSPKNPNEEFKAQANLQFDPGTPLVMEEEGNVLVDGVNVPLRTVTEQDMGFFLPDGEGGMVWSRSGRERPVPDPNYVDAREIKLQVRELADQLLSNIQQHELRGKVGMPTSFVNQDNFEQSSAFGRYIAEQMYHEFNQRGFPVREYRIAGQNIRMEEGVGDLYLSRDKGKVAVSDKANVVLVGTYYQDGNNVFINARLIRPSDGLVYRTGQMVMRITPTTKTMLAKTGRRLQSGSLSISSRASVNEAKAKSNKGVTGGASTGGKPGGADLSVLDQGFDVH